MGKEPEIVRKRKGNCGNFGISLLIRNVLRSARREQETKFLIYT